MSHDYNGEADNVSTGLAATVADATNASPIVVQTSAAHGYMTGDYVAVTGVLGNDAANGVWPIIVTDTTHFSLTGSTGDGAYTSGGTVECLSMKPVATLPDDGDAESAASVNDPFEAILDMVQFLGKNLRFKAATFLASGTWTVPAGCIFAWGIGAGGGGGGAAGSSGNGGGAYAPGGGGGAGASVVVLPVMGLVPGTVCTITIGAGGAGGSTDGSDGDNSQITIAGSPVATFPGGQGGFAAGGSLTYSVAGNQGGLFVSGGIGPAGSPARPRYTVALVGTGPGPALVANYGSGTIPATLFPAGCPGAGGGATGSHVANTLLATTMSGVSPMAGNTSSTGYSGGAPGTQGTTDGSYPGGGSGGGGGGGAFGAGGAAGNGGNGNGAGAGAAGTVGTAAAANSGGGGGGGGGGGSGSASDGARGSGGTGGSGKIVIVYIAND